MDLKEYDCRVPNSVSVGSSEFREYVGVEWFDILRGSGTIGRQCTQILSDISPTWCSDIQDRAQ